MTPIPMEGNLNDTEAWSGSVILGPGTHIVQCVSAKEGTTRTNGHPQIEFELEAVAGEEQGASIRDWITVIPATYGKVKQILLAFAAPIPGEGEALDAKVFVGKRCKIVVRREEKGDGSGDMRSNVKGYTALDPVDQVKSAFDAKEVGAGDDKDIPF